MMFLSKEALSKQLFHEFIHFKTLGLAPGKPVELKPGTLLGSSSKNDLALSIEFAERRLNAQLKDDEALPEVREQFNHLFASLIAYKKSSYLASNPFADYVTAELTSANPCAWLVFSPLFIEGQGESLSYENQADFLAYLNAPKVGFHFNKSSAIEQTGLYLAVQTNNHEMVAAFLCPEFYEYKLTKEDLKKLLSLTNEVKTRLALFRHCPDLITWISEDRELQLNSVSSFAELTELWAMLNQEQRKEFINSSNSQLWLKLLDKDLGKQEIVKLLGVDFPLLNTKLLGDAFIKTPDFLPTTLQYLSRQQHFNYLLNAIDLNVLYPKPRAETWQQLLFALGYQLNEAGQLTITRYILRGLFARVHNQLVRVLISLPVDTQVIVEALAKIEAYVHHPHTKDEYKGFLDKLASDLVNKEYETGFFIVNWFNKLLRYLNIKSASPLHPYMDKLIQVIQTEPRALISGELMDILPAKKDYGVYKESLLAYFDTDIQSFWSALPPEDQRLIVKTPVRFANLLGFLSAPQDSHANFLKALDKESLSYFNSPAGLRQLILDTPSFKVEADLPVLIESMQAKGLIFLNSAANIADLLTDDDARIFDQVAKYLPLKGDNVDSLLFQESILDALITPLPKEAFNRFLQAYCEDAHHFSTLLLRVNNSNPLLAAQCWDKVDELIWTQWYEKLDNGQEWAETLSHLGLGERLDFFEKLTSEGKLSTAEFCDFLLQKNEALWQKIPAVQWTTWLKDNPKLPATTKSLLDLMPYPLRVQFFSAMLKMTLAELAGICVAPNKTLEQFYPDDVKTKVSEATTVSDARAKLTNLKATKSKEFDDSVSELAKLVVSLSEHFNELGNTNVKAHNGWLTYGASFFKTDPYYRLVKSIQTDKSLAYEWVKTVSEHPLLTIVHQQEPARECFTHLITALESLNQQIALLDQQTEDMPAKLAHEFAALKLMVKKIEAINKHASILSPVLPEVKADYVDLSAGLAPM